MEITGKIIAVLEARSGVSQKTGNAWMTQQFILETHDQYPRKVCFDVFGEDRIKKFNLNIGEERTVSFDIDAREWTGKDGAVHWSNSVNAWRCIAPQEQQEQQQSYAPPQPEIPSAESMAGTDDFGSMPF